MTILLIACLTVVVVSFLCSLLEATLLSLDNIVLETKLREGQRHAGIWLNLKRRIDRPIAAILILNTVAHTGGATVAGGAFDKIYGEEWIWVFSLFFTIVVLLGTEIIPKIIGVNYSGKLAPTLAPLLSFMTTALSPVIAVTEWVARPFRNKDEKQRLSLADLRTMAELAHAEQLIGVQQQSIILNATKLRQMTVAAIMVPRERIAFFDLRLANIANFEVVASTLHTRYPVSQDGTVEGIKGYVNFKELVASAPSRRDVQVTAFIRPLFRIAAHASLNDALKVLLARREHIALVEDENRRVVGLVTLEDALEEIVGDLTDEFDQVTDELIRVADSRWKIGGAARMSVVASETGIACPDEDAALSLSDWMRKRLGRDLAAGDIVNEGGTAFTILQIRRRAAFRVLVETRSTAPTA